MLTAASASKVYDGTALTTAAQVPTYSITSGTFVGTQGLASVAVAGSQTVVGSSASTITGHTLTAVTSAANYNITYLPGTLEVLGTVTYNANTGTGSVPVDTTQYSYNDEVDVKFSPLPSKLGYTFLGWDENTRCSRACIHAIRRHHTQYGRNQPCLVRNLGS